MDKCFEAYIALIAILKAGGEPLHAVDITHISCHGNLQQAVTEMRLHESHAVCTSPFCSCLHVISVHISLASDAWWLNPAQAATCPLITRRQWSGCVASCACLGCRLLITQQSVAPAAEQLPPAVDILVADKGWHQFRQRACDEPTDAQQHPQPGVHQLHIWVHRRAERHPGRAPR